MCGERLVKKLMSFGMFVLVLASLLVGTLPALAHGEEVIVEPAQAKHGDTITVSGVGWEPNQVMTIALEGSRGATRLGEVTADAKGTFSMQFVIPEEIAPGKFQLKATTADGEVATTDFRVLSEEGASESGSHLVFQTNLSETIAISVIALALVAAGTILVVTARRESRA